MMDFSFGGLTINMSIRGILQAIPALPTAAYMWAGTHMALITSVSFYAMLTFIASTLWVGLEEQGHVPEISVVGDWTVAKGLQVISGATFFLGLIIINTIPDPEKVRIANKIQKRCYELQQQLGRSSGFGTTMSVGVAKGPGGDYVTLISTSEKGFYLRPGVTQMGNEIMVTGSGHAEVQIVDFCRQQNMHLLAVGASIDVCTECAPVITGAGADIVTPIEGERLINH